MTKRKVKSYILNTDEKLVDSLLLFSMPVDSS